jgi:hypothetical protein
MLPGDTARRAGQHVDKQPNETIGNQEDSDMNVEQWSCLNDSCPSGNWFVQRPVARSLVISVDIDDQPFRIAAGAPVCPYCGTTLSAAAQLEIAAQSALQPTQGGLR